MYWYLSFLRPPPVSVSEGTKAITITPQVANDLRTEIRTEPTEIYYLWQDISNGRSSKVTKAEHLTTYVSPGSTYKSISVPFPTSARPGQSWRLGLFPTDYGPDHQLLAKVLDEGSEVLGVWSGPIEISGAVEERQVKRAKLDGKEVQKGNGKGKGKEKEKDEGPKQTRIQREWTLGTEAEDEVQDMLRIIEQTSFDLDKKIWDSGLALAAWLRRRLDNYGAGELEGGVTECLGLLSGQKGEGTRRILELVFVVALVLGSGQVDVAKDLWEQILGDIIGTGLVSIALRQYLAGSSTRNSVEITATDLDSAMELMRENMALNDSPPSPKQMTDAEPDEGEPQARPTLSAKTLDWDESLPEWVTTNHPDIIIAADVTYNTSSFPSLVNTLRNLMLPPTGERPPLLLAYKQRDEAERELWGMLESEGIDLKKVDEVKGAEEEGYVEIWIGTAK